MEESVIKTFFLKVSDLQPVTLLSPPRIFRGNFTKFSKYKIATQLNTSEHLLSVHKKFTRGDGPKRSIFIAI